MVGVSERIVRAFALTLLTSVGLWSAFVSFASAEVITKFSADITVQANGSLHVEETITYDFEGEYRHGIYRNIRDSHPQSASSWLKHRYVSAKLISVTRDGTLEPYTLEDYSGLSVKVGDPNVTITGKHEYKIVYSLDGAIAVYDTGPEIYWNVTGDEWPVQMNEVAVKVYSTDGALLLPEQACYMGVRGAMYNCESTLLKETESVFSALVLAPSEGITVSQRLKLPVAPDVLERYKSFFFWIALYIVWFLGLLWYLLHWHFKFRKPQAIIAQYEPYGDFKPMFTGVLFDNKLDSRDIAAGIVYFAEQGYLSVKETKDKAMFIFEVKDYEFQLLQPSVRVESDFYNELMNLIGLTGAQVTNKLSAIKVDQSQRSQNAQTIAKLKKAVKSEMLQLGFLHSSARLTSAVVGVLVCVVCTLFCIFLFGISLPSGFWGVVILILITALFVAFLGLERRTALGYEALHYLKGFKDFLSTTEKERYTFHNAPSRSPQQFMEYLPYAIAFGVEKEWAEVFKDIPLDTPSWYSSEQNTAFNAVAFTHTINSFSTVFTGSVGTSGGYSGSGGGGFSGGGGGGGGGGSW